MPSTLGKMAQSLRAPAFYTSKNGRSFLVKPILPISRNIRHRNAVVDYLVEYARGERPASNQYHGAEKLNAKMMGCGGLRPTKVTIWRTM